MVTDIHKNEGQEEIDRIVADGMTGNESPKGMNYEEFCNKAESSMSSETPLIWAKSDVPMAKTYITKDIESKTTRPMDTLMKLFKFQKIHSDFELHFIVFSL